MSSHHVCTYENILGKLKKHIEKYVHVHQFKVSRQEKPMEIKHFISKVRKKGANDSSL